MSSRRWSGTVRLAALVLVTACGELPEVEPDVPSPDPGVFRDRVYPVLLADCGFNGCHGDPARAFAVFGPGRRRLRAETDLDAPATAEELAVSFTRARSVLVSPEGIERSPLVRKPLDLEHGGVSHGGEDAWGHNVYPTKDEPRFQVIASWAVAAAR